jgi:hypothetical protein
VSIVRHTHEFVLLVPPCYRALERILVGDAAEELGELALKTASDLGTAVELPLEAVPAARDRAAHASLARVGEGPAGALTERTAADRILVMGGVGALPCVSSYPGQCCGTGDSQCVRPRPCLSRGAAGELGCRSGGLSRSHSDFTGISGACVKVEVGWVARWDSRWWSSKLPASRDRVR